MEIKCKFKQQNDVVERGTFKSRKVWVITECDTKYPQTIELEVAQDKIDLFNDYTPGQDMTVSINLRGREWTNPQGEVKVFNTLQCWKVTSDVADQQEEEEAPKKKAAPKKTGNIEKKFEEEYINSLGGDLPF
jgi:hypothetical protein